MYDLFKFTYTDAFVISLMESLLTQKPSINVSSDFITYLSVSTSQSHC